MLRGKLSVDLTVREDGTDIDSKGVTCTLSQEDVLFAVEIVAKALDQLEERVSKMMEVVKIYWRQNSQGSLALCLNFILVEPRVSSRPGEDPKKFEIVIRKLRSELDLLGREKSVDLIEKFMHEQIRCQARYHDDVSVALIKAIS